MPPYRRRRGRSVLSYVNGGLRGCCIFLRATMKTDAAFGQPPMGGFLIHLLVNILVVGGLAALNMIINPNHTWVRWVLVGGIGVGG